jgi:hypothetical protein
MASQTFTVATIGGYSAAAVRQIFTAWEMAMPKDSEEANPAVDRFCEALRDRRKDLPILYYCEWIDRWSFGDDAWESTWHVGHRFWTCCMSTETAISLAARPCQHREQKWVSRRFLEAGRAQSPLAKDAVIVVMREVFSGSATDDEIVDALNAVPQWLNAENAFLGGEFRASC